MERYLEIDFMLEYLQSTPDNSNLQGKPKSFDLLGARSK